MMIFVLELDKKIKGILTENFCLIGYIYMSLCVYNLFWRQVEYGYTFILQTSYYYKLL